ncbi:hypothetical protein PLICRDRAFT_180427 [Plicaturopsis crispa FD-325 SS-3]|uniref:PARP-type domain-containing protein n=1 Tax=Plicaturopsis crispa FD-325 SS-3 TaxID=944288 RepID=A0A0C9SVY4_PLICR|nr:hypothetical protein PLICRDRAFT_180427 [Plicaturopsis crispa FD-325 SS-3]
MPKAPTSSVRAYTGVPKGVTIRLVPHAARNASCKACKQTLRTNSYCLKIGARYVHVACYEAENDLVAQMKAKRVELKSDAVLMDYEAEASLMQWGSDVLTEMEEAKGAVGSSTTSGHGDDGEGAAEASVAEDPRGKLAAEIIDAYETMQSSVTITFGPVGGGASSTDAVPRYPALLSEVLGAMQKKKRSIKGMAALRRSMTM